MMKRRSRTYRLRLSPAGTELFLSCHCRLAHLTGSLISYGTTLFVAILIADALESADIIAELELPSLKRFGGDKEHFVGASDRLAEIVAHMRARVERSDHIQEPPRMALLQMSCLAIMAATEDGPILKAYDRMHLLLSDH